MLLDMMSRKWAGGEGRGCITKVRYHVSRNNTTSSMNSGEINSLPPILNYNLIYLVGIETVLEIEYS